MAEINPPASGPSGEANVGPGQVCDRCRLKKIKCNGTVPCERCSTAGAECAVSMKLRRKTKARGFSSSEADVIKLLEDENANLRKQLEAESVARQRAQDRLDRNSIVSSRKKRRIEDQAASVSSESASITLDRDAFVIKHMGRLVRDDVDAGRFAGSTTGVHLVLSVQDKCRTRYPSLEPFPETCYKSYLIHPRPSVPFLHQVGMHMTPITVQDARAIIGTTLEDVSRQLRLFERYWSALCPSILRDEITRRARHLLNDSLATSMLQSEDYTTLQTILLIMLINRYPEADADSPNLPESQNQDVMLSVVCQLHQSISARVDVWSLQAIVLFSFYVQKSGKRQWMIPLNGVLVQMAQSLGLHRHARRFKFSIGEVEWRKRLWWSVYAFDKLTAVVHGLPQLVRDVDVDNDFPVDCILHDTKSAQLTHPLPGEPTPASIFCHYVKLTRIISRMLAQLYTTTDRREGANKIKQLDLDLRGWASELNKHPHVSRLSIGDSPSRRRKDKTLDENIIAVPWLELVANITRILIHLPGLTFDQSTSQFKDSLESCVSSAVTVVGLLDEEDLDPRVSVLSPCGPSIIFQCGLLQILSQCHTSASITNSPGQNPNTTRDHSRDTLFHSVDLLHNLAPIYDATLTSEGMSPLEELASTLRRLQNSLDSYTLPEHGLGNIDLITGQVPAPELQPTIPGAEVEIWSTTELESLNQFGDFDSIFTFGPTFD